MSRIIANNIRHNDATVDSITLDSAGNVSAPGNLSVTGTSTLTGNTTVTGSLTANGIAYPSAGPLSNRNLIINGAMQVAQRGTSSTSAGYLLDRFQFNQSFGEFAFTVSQDSSGPDGFSNCFEIDVTTAETAVGSNETAYIRHKIEAQNLQHLSYGTSAAQQVTLSFWVRSSVTGTYACSLDVRDGDRNIGSTYTINSANTWEYKTITFAGDASGTINDDNGEGMRVYWVLGAGTDFTTTDNTSWDTYTNARLAYGHAANNFVTTVNSNFRITGIQLEVGSVATPFEHRSYGDELARCQRYFFNAFNGAIATNTEIAVAAQYNSSLVFGTVHLPVEMRVQPSIVVSNAADYYRIYINNNDRAISTLLLDSASNNTAIVLEGSSSGTGGQAGLLRRKNSAALLQFSAEL